MKFPVSDTKLQDLLKRMAALGVRECDFEESFVKGAGAGGQKINKTSSAVWLKHTPTGLEVKCQESRQQSLNRFFARRMLVEKLETRVLAKASQQQQEIEKLKRQKRKRSKRAKAKMLDNKKAASQTKALRKKPSLDY